MLHSGGCMSEHQGWRLCAACGCASGTLGCITPRWLGLEAQGY